MATTPVAVIVAREKHIVEAFRKAGAITPDTAVDPAAIGVAKRVAFRKLCEHLALRQASPSTFYLDEANWREWRNRRRQMILLVVVLVLIAVVIAWSRTR